MFQKADFRNKTLNKDCTFIKYRGANMYAFYKGVSNFNLKVH